MKPFLTLCLLVACAAAQNTGAPVLLDSHSPSLKIAFTGQQQGAYRFQVSNQSSHAVTAFALRLVPGGIPNIDGHFACGDQCGRSVTLATNTNPAIKAGESVVRNFNISDVDGGAVIAEAAIFDDESYEGDVHAAGFLLASQIGRQAEYTRLFSTVSTVLAGAGDDAYKTMQLRMRLATVSLNVEPVMVITFRVWFPAFGDCIEPYLRVMKRAASRERQFLAESIEQFAHDTRTGKPTLTEWWNTAQEQLAVFGCGGCNTQALKPKAPFIEEAADVACHSDDLPVVFIVSYLGDEPETGQGDEDSELEAEEMAGIERTRPAHPPQVTLPPAVKATASAPAAVSESNVTVPLPRQFQQLQQLPSPPSGVPMVWRDGKLWVGSVQKFGRPVPDYLLYKNFFRDIDFMGDMALHQELPWENGKVAEYNGPLAGGLDNSELAILRKIASGCNQKVGALFTKRETLISTRYFGYPPGWMIAAPPLPGLREINEQERITLNACIAQLRTQLKPEPFSRLQEFARKRYDTSPGKVIAVPLLDDQLYGSFLQYFGSLGTVALNNLKAKQELSERQAGLRAAGLTEEDQALLKKLATDCAQIITRLNYQGVQRVSAGIPAVAAGVGQPLGIAAAGSPSAIAISPNTGTSAVGASLGEQVNVITAGPSSVMASPLSISSPMPNQVSSGGNPQPVAPPITQQDVMNTFSTGLTKLKTNLGEQKFRSLTAYVRRLYAPATREEIVALDAKAGKQVSEKMGGPAAVPASRVPATPEGVLEELKHIQQNNQGPQKPYR